MPAGTPPEALVAACCRNAEVVPAPLTLAAEMAAPATVVTFYATVFRRPFLDGNEEVAALVAPHLRPLDVVTGRVKGRLSGQMVPGYFTHAAIYLGTEAQLRAEGLWDLPALRPHQGDIRAGRVFLEAMPPRVRLVRLGQMLDVDALAVLRAPIGRDEKRAALEYGLPAVGRPFDFSFNADTPECLFCTELVHDALPSLGLTPRPIYGRNSLLPDDVAATALDGSGRTRLVVFIEGTRDGVRTGGQAELTRRLLQAWRIGVAAE